MFADDQKFRWALLDPPEAHVVLHYGCFNEPAKALSVFCVLLLD